MEVKKMFIDGEWVESSSGKTFKSINPSNGETLAEITEGTVEDVRKAVAAAKKILLQDKRMERYGLTDKGRLYS